MGLQGLAAFGQSMNRKWMILLHQFLKGKQQSLFIIYLNIFNNFLKLRRNRRLAISNNNGKVSSSTSLPKVKNQRQPKPTMNHSIIPSNNRLFIKLT